MDIARFIMIALLIGGGIYFAYWAIQKTLKEDESASKKRLRKSNLRRRK